MKARGKREEVRGKREEVTHPLTHSQTHQLTNSPTHPLTTHQLTTAVPGGTYKERVESAYAEVGRKGGEFLRAVCAFGALLDEVAAFLGATRGGDHTSKIPAGILLESSLKNWLAENCPEVNYNTAIKYKSLAGKAAKMIGGGTQAIAALQGRDTVAAPGTGEVIDVDATVIEKREKLFAEVDSRRKLEQAYFNFMYGGESRATAARPARAEKQPIAKLSRREEAKTIWNGVMQLVSKSSVRDSIPLLGEKETRICLDGLSALTTLLKEHLKEF